MMQTEGAAEGAAVATAPAEPIVSVTDQATAAMNDVAATASGWAAELERMGVEYGVKATGVIILLLVAWMFAGWLKRGIVRTLARAKLDPTVGKFLGNVVRWGVMVISLIACLGIFGVETTSFAAVIGAAGLAVGLALQGSLANLAAGIMLLVFRPYKVGDVIQVAGQLGRVDELELFTTSIDTPDNRRIIIPNGQIFGSVIENITHHPKRRVDVPVGVDYRADIDQTRRVLEAAANRCPGRAPGEPVQVAVLEFGASSVNWQVRVWAASTAFFDVRQGLMREIKLALDEAGIGIPFPQMDVYVKQIVSKD